MYNDTGLINTTAYTDGTRTVNFTGLDDNNYTYNVSVNDSAGNINETGSRLITLDSTKPLISYADGMENTGSNVSVNWIFVNVSVTETNEDSIVFRLYNDTGLINTTIYTDSTRTINFTGLDDNNYTYNVSVNDTFGNENSTASRIIELETTNPLISYGGGMENDGANVSVDWIFVNVSVTETNENAVTFRLYNDTGLINTTTYTDSTYSVNFTGLDDNNYTYNVSVNDTFGNSNSTGSRLITLDTTIPVVSVESPSSQNYSVSVVGFNITLEDAGSVAWFSLDSGVSNYTMTKFNDTLFNYTNLTMGDDSYTVQFYVNDSVGNLNNTVSVDFGVDTTLPLISYGGGIEADGANVSASWIFVNVSVTETNEDSIVFRLYNDTGLINTTIYTDSTYSINFTGLGDNNYTYNVSVNDSAGNINSTDSRLITLDTDIPLIDYADGMENDSANVSVNWIFVNVSVTETDEDSIVFRLYNDTGLINTTIYTDATRTINFTGLDDNNYTYNVSVNDTFGNSNDTSSRTIELDTVTPGISYGVGMEDDAANVSVDWVYINVSVTEDNEDSITFRLYNSSALVNTTIYTDGTRSINFTGLDDLVYIYNVSVNDTVGKSNSTVSRSIGLDTITPEISYGDGMENDSANVSTSWIFVNVSVTEASEDSVIFRLYNSSGLINTTIYTDGTRTINFTGLGSNNYTYNVSVNDSSGRSNVTDTRSLKIDVTSPVITVNLPSNVTYTDANQSLMFNVSLDEIGGTVMYSFDSGVNNISMDASGLYHNASNGTIADGSYVFQVYSNDSLGNRNDSVNVTFSFNHRPSVVLNSPTGDKGFSNGNISFSYNVSDAGDILNCSLLINSVVNLTNSSAVTENDQEYFVVNFSVGNYGWKVRCFDTLGAFNDSVTRLFTVFDIGPEFVGETTNISAINVSNVSSFVLDNPSYGVINFTESVNLTLAVNISDHVNISDNRIEINTSALSGLNASATLTLYGLTLNNPQVLRDGDLCGDLCVEGEYTDDGNFTFNVTGFSVYSAGETPVPSSWAGSRSSGGGGGSPAAVRPKTVFEVVPEQLSLKMSVDDQETKVLTVKNNWNKEINVEVEVEGIEEFVIISDDFKIGASNEKLLAVVIDNLNVEQRIITGKIILRSEGHREEVLVVINMRTRQFLFDSVINVLEESRVIEAGEVLKTEIDLLQVGIDDKVDVFVNYVIKDFNGKVYLTEDETFFVLDEKKYRRIFETRTLPPGEYVIGIEVEYEDTFATASSYFKVESGEFSFDEFIDTGSGKGILLALLSLLVLIVLLILFVFVFVFTMIWRFSPSYVDGRNGLRMDEFSGLYSRINKMFDDELYVSADMGLRQVEENLCLYEYLQ